MAQTASEDKATLREAGASRVPGTTEGVSDGVTCGDTGRRLCRSHLQEVVPWKLSQGGFFLSTGGWGSYFNHVFRGGGSRDVH